MKKLSPLWMIFPLLMACLLLPSNDQPAMTTSPAGDNPHYPFPQHRTYAPGTIRPNLRTQAQQDDDVRAFYDHWKANYLLQAGTTPAGDPLYRVSFGSTNPGRTVSEGQGFGMVIVAIMAGHDPNAHTLFDGLWEFARTYPSACDPRLMAWQIPGSPGGDCSAFDGDADMAYGLLLAHAQWGSQGRINYQSAANELITAILQSTIGPDSHLPMLGDWVNPTDPTYNQFTPRTSDFMLAHFRAYGQATGNPVWSQVITATQQLITALQNTASPTTGLLPDFVVNGQPAPAGFLEGPHDGHYYYNAGRDPWRLATDALLSNDPASRAIVGAMSTWIEQATAGQPQAINPGYYLNGDPLPNQYFTTFFVAPFGVAAMTRPEQQQWLNAIYEAVYNSYEDYYEDSVTLLCLLVMTGNYWNDAPAGISLYLPLLLYNPG